MIRRFEYSKLLSTLSPVNLDGSNDNSQWCLAKDGPFIVKSFYKHLFWYEENGTRFLVQKIWKATITPCISFFAWETSKECILTIDNLRRKCKILVNACYLCKRTEETWNHLLLWCLVVYKFLTMVYRLLGISWVMTGSVRDEIWHGRALREGGSKRG